MRPHQCVPVCFVALLSLYIGFLAPCVSVGQPTFRKVADLNTSVPNGSGIFSTFAKNGVGGPSIENGTIVFFGKGSGAADGIYVEKNGALSKLVDNSDGYSNFGSTISVSGDRASFSATGPLSQTGIFTSNGITTSALVDTATAHPNGLGNFGIFGNHAIDGNLGVFFGGNNSDTGIYMRSVSGGAITTVAERLDNMPGSVSDHFLGFGRPDIENDKVVFNGSGGATLQRKGVYVYSNNVLSTLYDTSTPIPGGTGNFLNFANARLSNGKILFYGEGDTEQGFYSDVSGTLDVVADRGTPVPGGGTFDDHGFVYGALDGDNVTFWSYLTGGGSGIYTTLGGALQEVIRTGATLDGQTVSDLDFGREGFNGDDIAFRAVFSNGSQGIYVASFGAAALSGDFNQDGTVDAADYTVWRKGLGGAFTPAQYDVWRAHFGDTSGGGMSSLVTIPEPAPGVWLLITPAILSVVRYDRFGGQWRVKY